MALISIPITMSVGAESAQCTKNKKCKLSPFMSLAHSLTLCLCFGNKRESPNENCTHFRNLCYYGITKKYPEQCQPPAIIFTQILSNKVS